MAPKSMIVVDKPLSSFQAFLEFLDHNRAPMYRGVADASWRLIPRIGRMGVFT
jgi:hypothetical protein